MIGESAPVAGTDAFARRFADYERRVSDLERKAGHAGPLYGIVSQPAVMLLTSVTLPGGSGNPNATSDVLTLPLPGVVAGDRIRCESFLRATWGSGVGAYLRTQLLMVSPAAAVTSVLSFDVNPNSGAGIDLIVPYGYPAFTATVSGTWSAVLRCATAIASGSVTVLTNTSTLRAEVLRLA